MPVTQGTVAVVTGGARGIGFAVAEHLADDGYTVVMLDTGTTVVGEGSDAAPVAEAAAVLTGRGRAAEGMLCDVRDAATLRSLAADVERRLGPVAVVANVAGIVWPAAFLDDTEDRWEAVLSTHLAGHLNVVQAFLPGMLARRSGHVVNFTSTGGLLGSGAVAYGTAKEAIVGLTRYLARSLAGTGVRVHAVSPSADTRMGRLGPTPDRAEDDGSPFTERDPGFVGRFVRWLVGSPAATDGSVYLVSGRYVTEFEHLRLSKWAALASSASDADAAALIDLALRRPHPAMIGPWPTRDFRFLEVERYYEAGPEPVRGVGDLPMSSDAPAVIGVGDDRTARIADALASSVPARIEPASLGSGAPVSATSRRGVLVVPPLHGTASTGARDVGPAGTEQDTRTICASLLQMLRSLQSGLWMTGPHKGASLTVVLPGSMPWLASAPDVVEWMLWYGAVGAVRSGAATEASYGVRVNGLVIAPGTEERAAPVIRFAMQEGRDWFNGCLLTCDDEGVGLLADERPRWQCFSGDVGPPVPGSFIAAGLGDHG